MSEAPKITKCPPGEAIGYRNDDIRLSAWTRNWLRNWEEDLRYETESRREAAKTRNFNGTQE